MQIMTFTLFMLILLLCIGMSYYFGRTIAQDAEKAKEQARDARAATERYRAELREQFNSRVAEEHCNNIVLHARLNERQIVLDEEKRTRKETLDLCDHMRTECERLQKELEQAKEQFEWARAEIRVMRKNALRDGERHAATIGSGEKNVCSKKWPSGPDGAETGVPHAPAQRMPGESYGEPLEEINGVMQAMAEYAAQRVEYRR